MSLGLGGNKAYLQISLNVAKERNIADTGDCQQQKRAGKHDKGEKRSDGQGGRRKTVPSEVLRYVEPWTIVLLGKVNAVESQGVDSLSRTIRQ